MEQWFGVKFIKENILGSTRKNSTNNASLTELIPCILFKFNELYNQEINQNFIDKIVDYIKNSSKMNESFLGNDKEAALKTFKEIDLNDKLTISKINSGKQCYKLMKDILSSRRIEYKNIYWCYRLKPEGVSSSNPSDVIILGKNENGEEKYLGFSFKSGKFESEKGKGGTKEPKLNSYVITVLKMYNENVLNDFYKKFNIGMKEIFSSNSSDLPSFNPRNENDLNDWKEYKNENSFKLMSINLNDDKFRKSQKLIIDFFIELFKNDKKSFKQFFINKCLGTMNFSDKNDETNNFFEDGFFVLKGDERIRKNEQLSEARIITPDIQKYQKMNDDDIKIIKDENSVQSFYVYFGEDKYMFSVRTSSGKSCKELPNLKFVCQ